MKALWNHRATLVKAS